MRTYSGSLILQFQSLITGNAAAGVSVQVFSGTTGSTLYTTLTTDSAGYYSFSGPDGAYRLKFGLPNIPDLYVDLIDALQLKEDIESAISTATWSVVSGSFETGGTITARNQVLLRDADGFYFSWGGALPKVVIASSTVAGTGGEGDLAWTNRNDATFASALAAEGSQVLIGGVTAEDVAAMVNAGSVSDSSLLIQGGLKELQPLDYRIQSLQSYFASVVSGGGQFVYIPTVSKAAHNGGTYIAPEAIMAWNGTVAGIATLLNWTGSGSGVYVRIYDGVITPQMFGAVTTASDSALAITKSFQAVPRNGRWAGEGSFTILNTVVCDGKKESEFRGLSMRLLIGANVKGLIIDNMEDCIFELGASMGIESVFNPTEHPIELKSITGSTIDIRNARFCAKGVLVNPVGDSGGVDPNRKVDGFYYNNVYLAKVGTSITDHGLTITTTTNTLHPNPSLGKSYVNSNDFYVRNIRCAGSGIRTVKGVNQVDPFNANTFHSPGLEVVKGVGLDFEFATANVITQPRFESPDSFGNFATAMVRESSDCSYNQYQFNFVNADRVILQGVHTTLKGFFIDTLGSYIADEIFHRASGVPRIHYSKASNVNITTAKNHQSIISGNTFATSQNVPFSRYAGFIKDSEGITRPYGLLSPHDAQLIGSFTNNQTIQINAVSYVRLLGGTPSDTVTLRMNSSREIDGYMLLLEIASSPTCNINIQRSDGVADISSTLFNPSGTETRGLFAIIYRDFGWRASRIGERLAAS